MNYEEEERKIRKYQYLFVDHYFDFTKRRAELVKRVDEENDPDAKIDLELMDEAMKLERPMRMAKTQPDDDGGEPIGSFFEELWIL